MTKLKSTAWWGAYPSDVILPHYAQFLADESRADTITAYCLTLLCGLFQTERYARAVLETKVLISNSIVEARVKARMERQWHFFEQQNPPKINFLMGEHILRRPLGGVEVLREQILHLIDMAQLPNVDIRIVPMLDYDSPFGLEPGMCHLFSFNDLQRPDTLYIEPYVGQYSRSDNAVELRYFRRAFDFITNESFDKETSLKLLQKRATELLRQQERLS